MNGHLTPALIASSLTALFALGISQQTHAADYTPISETCGATTATLQCKAGSRDCTQTTLNLKTADGKTVPLEKPKGLEKQYTAVGLVCAKATDQTPYVKVEYGELPRGCEYCEWVALYDTKGTLLTHNDPAILIDETRGTDDNKYPNNKEFTTLAKKLGLPKTKYHYLQAGG